MSAARDIGINLPAVPPKAVDEPGQGFFNPRPVRIPFARMVRWRFDYHDGKPTKVGMWCRPAELQSDMAAFQDKTNLRRAAIEVKEALTAKVYPLVECDGPEFVNFEWAAGSPLAVSLNKPIGEQKLYHQIIGLTMVTRELRVTVHIDGSEPKVELRSEAEKSIHLAGFGR